MGLAGCLHPGWGTWWSFHSVYIVKRELHCLQARLNQAARACTVTCDVQASIWRTFVVLRL